MSIKDKITSQIPKATEKEKIKNPEVNLKKTQWSLGITSLIHFLFANVVLKLFNERLGTIKMVYVIFIVLVVRYSTRTIGKIQ